MADGAHDLIDIATAIADGTPIQWPPDSAPGLSDADRRVLRHLHVIADIVAVQQQLASSALHTSVVEELQQESPRGRDAREMLPSWGPLRLIRLAGHGAFGEVYQAWDARLDRDVALKLLRRRESRRAAGSSLVDEGRLLAKVRHPNVITVYGAERIGDHVGVWMEFIDGPTLAEVVGSKGPYGADEVARIGRDLCSALGAVHRAGLLHRDIKAQNVMRAADGRVVLMDFGAGREDHAAIASPRDMAGTPLYLAPEIFSGSAASPQSDIYSLGVLLYYLATGTYPVAGTTVAAIRDAHRREARRSVSSARGDLPPTLAEVIDRALSPQPSARFEDARAMELALAAATPQAEPSRPRRYRVVIPIVTAAAVVAAALFALQRIVAPRASTAMVIRRVAADAPIDGTSGLSGDGRYVSHVDWTGTGNLVITDLSTGTTRALTAKKSWLDSTESADVSAFSPDDEQIAYVWLTATGDYDLRVAGVHGSAPRVIYRDAGMAYIPRVAWTPDGRNLLIVVNRHDDTHQIALVPVAGGPPVVLKSFDAGAPDRIAVSPDGRYLAYDLPQHEGASERDIASLALDGSNEAPLVQHPANDFVLGWTPDGARFLFGSDRSGTTGAWSVRVSEGRAVGAAELFRPDLGTGWPIRLTPSGSFFYGVPVNTNDIFIATLDPTASTIVDPPKQAGQRSAGTNKWPEWSPDGRELAYVSQFRVGTGAAGPLTLAIESPDEGVRRNVATPLTFFSRLRWSPDGRTFLANARDDHGRGGLYTIDARTGESVMLLRTTGLPREAAWLHDGHSVLYWDPSAGPDASIVERVLSTGAERAVFGGGDFAVSPDNRWLTVAQEATSNTPAVLKLVPLDGGAARDLMEVGSGSFNLGCSWAPDSLHGLCVVSRAGSSAELWRFSINGSAPRRLRLMDGVRSVCVSPDGRRIAFSVGKGSTELWVTENFLP